MCVQYSGVEEGRPLAMVLRMETGSIDRPACIQALSQYPGEVEYLWPPCSYLEPDGAPAVEAAGGEGGGGVVRVQGVRVKVNLKALTVEELQGRKLTLHLAAFEYGNAETRRQLDTLARDHKLEDRLARDPLRVLDLQQWLKTGGKEETLSAFGCVVAGGEVTFTAGGLVRKLVADCEAVRARPSPA